MDGIQIRIGEFFNRFLMKFFEGARRGPRNNRLDFDDYYPDPGFPDDRDPGIFKGI